MHASVCVCERDGWGREVKFIVVIFSEHYMNKLFAKSSVCSNVLQRTDLKAKKPLFHRTSPLFSYNTYINMNSAKL